MVCLHRHTLVVLDQALFALQRDCDRNSEAVCQVHLDLAAYALFIGLVPSAQAHCKRAMDMIHSGLQSRELFLQAANVRAWLERSLGHVDICVATAKEALRVWCVMLGIVQCVRLDSSVWPRHIVLLLVNQ